MKTVCIIGAGASGSLIAYHLSHSLPSKKHRIILIEKQHAIGRGLAYSTQHPEHLLNVPAHNMSALHNSKSDFTDWLKAQGLFTTDDDFMPREWYGKYLSDIIHVRCSVELESGKLQLVHAEAISCTQPEGAKEKYVIECSDQRKIHASIVILAMGNFDPMPPVLAGKDFLKWQHYFANPWSEEFKLRVNPDGDGLIIGSGLTMVDVVSMLNSKGMKGTLYSVSTHGFLPQPHEKTEPLPQGEVTWNASMSFQNFYTLFLRERKRLLSKGANWRAIVDSLRPFHQQIWLSWSTDEKQSFLRHLRHIWGVMRHRMPPKNAAMLHKLLQTKQLQLFAGRIESLNIKNKKVYCQYTDRSSGERKEIIADWAVNCTGPMSAPGKTSSPLMNQLYADGIIKPDNLNMGIDTTPEGHVLNKNDESISDLLAVGPMMKGVLWEITAMPEIRKQAYDIAHLVVKTLSVVDESA